MYAISQMSPSQIILYHLKANHAKKPKMICMNMKTSAVNSLHVFLINNEWDVPPNSPFLYAYASHPSLQVKSFSNIPKIQNQLIIIFTHSIKSMFLWQPSPNIIPYEIHMDLPCYNLGQKVYTTMNCSKYAMLKVSTLM